MLKKNNEYCDVEKMLQLKDVLLKLEPSAFDMEDWWEANADNECGTAGCIAGWACFMENKLPEYGSESTIPSIAKDILGIKSLCYATELFYGTSYATTEQAARAIDNMIETGKPNWHQAKYETSS